MKKRLAVCIIILVFETRLVCIEKKTINMFSTRNKKYKHPLMKIFERESAVFQFKIIES